MQGELQPWEIYKDGTFVGIIYAATDDKAKELGAIQYNLPKSSTVTVQRTTNRIRTKG